MFSGLVRTIIIASRDSNKKLLLECAREPENNNCADCGAPEPEWASCKLGVFLCQDCAAIHRNLTSSKIKSIRLDFWDDEMVQYMKEAGNVPAREVYEKEVPVYFWKPQQDDCAVLREQWIYAKYDRLEFNGNAKYPPLGYNAGFYEGLLWKKGKRHKQFMERKFVLSETDFTLVYYNDEDETKGPKAVIPIKDLNVMMNPEKVGHDHGMQITFLENKHVRNVFVYHESGEEIVTWFNAFRAARYNFLKMAYPTGSDSELMPKVTSNYLKEGFMEKTGPIKRSPYRKRWFSLDGQGRKLLYYTHQLDAVELGAVFLGTEAMGYFVNEKPPKENYRSKFTCGIRLQVPGRQFTFMCELEEDRKEWMLALRGVIARPMEPQDYATEAIIRAKR